MHTLSKRGMQSILNSLLKQWVTELRFLKFPGNNLQRFLRHFPQVSKYIAANYGNTYWTVIKGAAEDAVGWQMTMCGMVLKGPKHTPVPVLFGMPLSHCVHVFTEIFMESLSCKNS